MDKVAEHPSGLKIIFNEEEHTYHVDGTPYMSVTKLIHSQFPEFDTDKIAGKYAKKHGRTKDDVLMEWDAKNKEACEYGTNVHLYCENLLLDKPLPEPISEKAAACFPVVEKFIGKLRERYELIDSEKIVFCPEFRISGTVDLLMRHKKTGNIVMMDWKTNKAIKKTNDWGERGRNFLRHLPHCNFTHYCLQLNIYKYILEREGYFDKIYAMRLFHVHDGIVDSHKVNNMKSDVMLICMDRKNNL